MSFKDIIDALDIDQEAATNICKVLGGIVTVDMAVNSVSTFSYAVKLNKAKQDYTEDMQRHLPSVGKQIATGTIFGLAAAAAGYITAKAFDVL